MTLDFESFAKMNAALTEAYLVERGIACTRKFTDAELAPVRAEVRETWRKLYGEDIVSEEKENAYANEMIKREQLARHGLK